eukprot:Skav224510  [mRNA]  locus=scaffold825:20756:32174:- [translate_table: standard]
MSKILTNPGSACEQAIERSFTRRNWRHVVMYAVDPTQYLFMEFHKEWESFKQGLVDKYCQELKNNFGQCLRVAEERLQDLLTDQTLEGVTDLTMNKLSQEMMPVLGSLMDFALSTPDHCRRLLLPGQECWGPSLNERLQPLADRMRSMLLTALGYKYTDDYAPFLEGTEKYASKARQDTNLGSIESITAK